SRQTASPEWHKHCASRRSAEKCTKSRSEAAHGENNIETVWGRGYVLRDPEPVKAAPRLAMGA
ncbi:MAG: hypothetical protein ACNA7N_13440, partial [Yoonia sp.]